MCKTKDLCHLSTPPYPVGSIKTSITNASPPQTTSTTFVHLKKEIFDDKDLRPGMKLLVNQATVRTTSLLVRGSQKPIVSNRICAPTCPSRCLPASYVTVYASNFGFINHPSGHRFKMTTSYPNSDGLPEERKIKMSAVQARMP